MNDQLLPEEEILSLEDDEGNLMRFRVLDRITDGGRRYIVLSDEELDGIEDEDVDDDEAYEDDPSYDGSDDDLYDEVDDDSEEDEDDDGGVMVYRIADREDGAEDFEPIEDEDELQRIFDYFVASREDYEFGDAE